MKIAIRLLVLVLCFILSGCIAGVVEPSADTEIPTTVSTQEEIGIEETHTIPENVEKMATTGDRLVVGLTFTRAGTMASNQYAVWIEDGNGKLVKTLYVSSFTANGGYARRAESLPTWVFKANPAEMEAAAVDAITSATPQSGLQRHPWDGTNESGDAMPPGEYHVFVEGTLYWTSSVLYSGSFEWGGDAATVEMTPVYTEEDHQTNRDMMTHVSAEYIAKG